MRIRICICDNWIFSPPAFLLQSSWNKSANQPWTNSIARYGDTITKEPLPAVNGSLKLPSSAGQKLLLQALVYDAVMVCVFGPLLTCVFWHVFSISVPHLPFSFLQHRRKCFPLWASFSWLIMGFTFFPGYRSVCQQDWWNLSKSCLVFPSIAQSFKSPLIFCLDSSQPLRAYAVGLFFWWWSSRVRQLGCQQGCGSLSSRGPGARHQQSALSLCCGHAASSLLNEWGAAMLSTVIKIYSVLIWRRNCIFACKRSQRSRVETPSPDRVDQFPLHLSSLRGCIDWEEILFLILLHWNKYALLCLGEFVQGSWCLCHSLSKASWHLLRMTL